MLFVSLVRAGHSAQPRIAEVRSALPASSVNTRDLARVMDKAASVRAGLEETAEGTAAVKYGCHAGAVTQLAAIAVSSHGG